MKAIKMMEADHVYLMRGASTARSPFFEREADCKVFLELADRYLGEYLKILRFQNNRDGWVMIVRTRSAIDIKRAYFFRRNRSEKCDRQFDFVEVWQMLSDQVRIFLSTYVKATNYISGRKGGKVRRRFERFVFENEEEYRMTCEALEQQYYFQGQPRKRYRPSKRSHELRKKLVLSSKYMCSGVLKGLARVRALGLVCLDLRRLADDVVRQLIATTLQHHFQP